MRHDDPSQLAAAVAACPRPLLVGLDVDGVLAPIVDHAADALLLDGMAAAIESLVVCDATYVAVISGRALDDLARFGFGDGVSVIGSHGMEVRGRAMAPLDADERRRLDVLSAAAAGAAHGAGDGAWVESKPASVVLHVRQADEERGRRALAELAAAAEEVPGAASKAGSGVLEVFARHASKGSAITDLAGELSVATTVFVGDDVTDEEAFAALRTGDVPIKVGDAPTIARHRLADPPAVLAWLGALADRLR